MKATVTEYKPHGIWRGIGLTALALFPMHIWIMYRYVQLGQEYANWFFSPMAAGIGLVLEPLFIIYMLTIVNIVTSKARGTVRRSWVLFGIRFNGKEISIGDPDYISLTRHTYRHTTASGDGYNTELQINAWNDSTHKHLFSYSMETDARHVAEGIANALGVPFNDYT